MATEPTRALVAEQTLIDGKFQAEMAVLVAGGRIVNVRPVSEVAEGTPVERFPRRLMVPGTLNAHNHSFQSLLRGIADDCDFFTWRDRALYGYAPYMNEETVYQGARFAFAEMIRNGVTTVCDFFYIHDGSNVNDHAVIRAAQDLGMRIVLARTMYDWDGAPPTYQESIADAVARTRELWQEYRGRDDVHVCPAPHSPHAASPEMIQAGSALAEELDTRFHIHVAEGRYERDTIREKPRQDADPLAGVDWALALERMTIIHGCWLEEDDIG